MSLIDVANDIAGGVSKLRRPRFWVVYYDEATNTITLKNAGDSEKDYGYTAEELEFIGKDMSPCPEYLIIDCFLPKDCSNLFYGMKELKKVSLGENFDSSRVTNMSGMFADCCELEEFDASRWDTSNVRDFSNMFDGCKKLRKLDLSAWDVQSVHDMSHLFYGCEALEELDVSSWRASSRSLRDNMLGGCASLKRDKLPEWAQESICWDAYTN